MVVLYTAITLSSRHVLGYSQRFSVQSFTTKFRSFSALIRPQWRAASNTAQNSPSLISTQLFSTYIRVDPNTMSGLEPNATAVSPDLLPFTEDKYDGVIVSSKSLPDTDENFERMLDHSLEEWRKTNRRGVWIKVPLEKSSFIPIAVRKGFTFHHAEKQYVMLTHWLAEGESRLPPNASHQVGVGCIVLHEGKMLLVQEKSGPLKGTGVWKMPTGLVDVGEDISTGAEREVFEETGVRTRFKKLLAFRQAHGVLFGKSDLFLVCVLEPLSSDISPQEAEIHACEWKEPETLLDSDFFQKSPLYSFLNHKIRREVLSAQGKATPPPSLVKTKLPLGFRPGEASLYFFDSDDESSISK